MYCYRGSAYHRKGELNLAIDDFTKATELDSELAEAYLNRGIIYGETGDFDKAIDDFTKLIQLIPDDAMAYFYRGLTHGKKGDPRKALTDFTEAIKVNPDDGMTYFYRGNLWLHLREWAEAKSDLMTAQNMGTDIIASFHNEYVNVEDFEQETGIQLPEDIAEMLTQQ